MDALEICKVAASVASSKKATRIMVLDLKGKSDVCTHMMICSGQNDRQTKAIAQEVQENLRARGVKILASEGSQSGNWVLLDYGPAMVHIFLDYLRDYYALEKLHASADFLKY